MVSAPRGMLEWAAKGTGGQADKVPRKKEDRVVWAGKRAPGPRPLNSELHSLSCWSQEKHIQCVLGWENGFF